MSVRIELNFGSVEEFEQWAGKLARLAQATVSQPQEQSQETQKQPKLQRTVPVVGKRRAFKWTKGRVRFLRKQNKKQDGFALGISMALGNKYKRVFSEGTVQKAIDKFCKPHSKHIKWLSDNGRARISTAAKAMHKRIKDYVARHPGTKYAEAKRIVAGLGVLG